MLKSITTNQFLIKLEEEADSGIIDFRYIDFQNVDLRNSKTRAKFNEICEFAASRSSDEELFIDFTGADISRRDFSNYDLTNVTMSDIIAINTIFTGSDLSDVQMDGAKLDNADFREAKLSFAKFYGASIIGTNFNNANLENAQGLGLTHPSEETIERLGVAASIKDAILPANIEPLRAEIEEAIIQKNSRKKISKPNISLVETETEQDSKKSQNSDGW